MIKELTCYWLFNWNKSPGQGQMDYQLAASVIHEETNHKQNQCKLTFRVKQLYKVFQILLSTFPFLFRSCY